MELVFTTFLKKTEQSLLMVMGPKYVICLWESERQSSRNSLSLVQNLAEFAVLIQRFPLDIATCSHDNVSEYYLTFISSSLEAQWNVERRWLFIYHTAELHTGSI